MELKKTFIAGKMNKDLDERLVPDGEYIDALNVTIDTTSGSNIGAVSNSLGNTLVSNIQQLVEGRGVTYTGSNAKTIGAVTYEADNLIYWLVTSDTFDAIFEYSEIYQFTSIVLLCTQGQLNFNKSYPVTGINFIPVSRDEGPFIYWTDGLNPPRRINIARSKSYITDDPRIVEDINVILRPPLYSPKIDLSFNSEIETSNNIQDKFIYFSYRFKYKDNQYSSLSPFSSVAFHASGFAYDYNTGDNKGMLNKYNKVDVTVDTGNEFVEQIQLLYFDTYRLNVYIIDNYNKADIQINDNDRYTIPFSANKIYTPLESSEVTRLFDNVPLSAKAQEIIGNRLVYGNYVQFRDIVNANGIKIVPDYTLILRDESITTEPKKTFRSDRDYEIGIIYLDEYGRMTTALTSKENTLYIPSLNSDKANSIEVTLNNEPPFWATNYRFAIKQAQGDYYNIFPRLFIADGVFRYFLINESDRDKITVGGYIIFKTSNGIATYSNKQFKVLELEYKDATSPFSTAGLYFKIKADPADVFLDNPQSQTYYTYQGGRGPRPSACVDGDETVTPVRNRSNSVKFEYAYYANNGDNTLIYPNQNNAPNINISISYLSSSYLAKDYRISIKILPDPSNPTNIGTHFQWTTTPDADSGWNGPYLIPVSTSSYTITLNVYEFELTFDSGNYNIGDIYVFNARANFKVLDTVSDYRLSTVIDAYTSQFPYGSGIPVNSSAELVAYDPDDYGGHAILPFNGPIYPGANININIIRDTPPNSNDPIRNQTNNWVSDNYYKNLEEWFWKSGAYQSFKYKDSSDNLVTSANNIMFRRSQNGTVPLVTGNPTSNYILEDPDNGVLCMLIRGIGDKYICNRNEILCEISITQTPTVQLSAETVPLESDIDIFYEMRKTYRIENGNHMVSWPYVDFTEGGSVFPTVPEASGKTVLGPANPNLPTSTDLMHSFNVGEKVWVQNSDITPPIVGPISGEYTILYVTNYAIVIDLAFPGIGPVTPGKVYYKQWESDQDFNNGDPLIVELNNVTSDNSDFNAFAFGNGVESYRIYDNFLRPTMKYSPRATSVIEDYKQEDKIASLCYSGIYKGDTSTNRLNSFNLSQANFKNLDKQYGPIQKLYALDTNLMVLQQDKITSVLYGKNLLVDAVGGGQVASVPEVLGNQIVHPSEYGISNNPESFAKFANIVFFTDARRGAVLQMTGDQVMEISANGMKNYFRDELKDNPNTQKLGMYDPYNETYVLAFTDAEQEICNLSLSQTALTKGWNTYGDPFFMFSILSSTYWTITLEDTGDGTDWIDLVTELGYGDQDIYANIDSNETESVRSVDFVVEYCDGLTATFTLTQNGFILPPPPEEDL
jgi:hypothetical protein